MNATEYLLQTLTEELSEAIQSISKIQRFGPCDVWPPGAKETNMDKLVAELNDIFGTVEMCEERGVFPAIKCRTMIELKKAKIRKWMRHSRKLRRLE